MNVKTSINAAQRAMGRRQPETSGYFGTRGWRRVKERSTAQRNHPVHKYLPRGSMTKIVAREIQRCQRGKIENTMWPPSSCPTGSRFSAVANIPTHAARATGCR